MFGDIYRFYKMSFTMLYSDFDKFYRSKTFIAECRLTSGSLDGELLNDLHLLSIVNHSTKERIVNVLLEFEEMKRTLGERYSSAKLLIRKNSYETKSFTANSTRTKKGVK